MKKKEITSLALTTPDSNTTGVGVKNGTAIQYQPDILSKKTTLSGTKLRITSYSTNKGVQFLFRISICGNGSSGGTNLILIKARIHTTTGDIVWTDVQALNPDKNTVTFGMDSDSRLFFEVNGTDGSVFLIEEIEPVAGFYVS